jgi:hypothetical protein
VIDTENEDIEEGNIVQAKILITVIVAVLVMGTKKHRHRDVIIEVRVTAVEVLHVRIDTMKIIKFM